MKDKSYRVSPVGEDVGRYMRALRWSDKAQNTLDTYEIVLARLAVDFAHYQSLDEFTIDTMRGFLDEHWGTRRRQPGRNRLAAVRSFFQWAVEEGEPPATPPPDQVTRVRTSERHAYKPDLIHPLIAGATQVARPDRPALLGRLGLRKNELRLLRLKDFDLYEGTVLSTARATNSDAAPRVRRAEERPRALPRRPRPRTSTCCTRQPTRRPDGPGRFTAGSSCLDRAGLPASVKVHELRHSAADNLWRQTGNLLLVQPLLRHESVATTQKYLHPNRDDLSAALASLDTLPQGK